MLDIKALGYMQFGWKRKKQTHTTDLFSSLKPRNSSIDFLKLHKFFDKKVCRVVVQLKLGQK